MTDTAPALLWFRRDLRLRDNPALQAAMASGRPVLPFFVLDDATPGAWSAGGASRWWLHHSLAALRADLAALGATLVLRRGRFEDEIPRLMAETGAAELHAGLPTEPWSRNAYRSVKDALGDRMHVHLTTLVFPPDSIRTQNDTPYGVYSPFARACLLRGVPPAPVPAPTELNAAAPPPSDRLEDWKLLPTHPDWAGGLRASWTPGEAGAQNRLERFLDGVVGKYAAARDIPGTEGTSMLSPHLTWGEISPSEIWHRASASNESGKFINEVLWREFAANLLWHHQELPDKPLRPQFVAMPWRSDAEGLHAWQRGMTGIPVVDAGMRQLWQTGWMHNRVRMITASFLIKHLLIPWQDGEAWFWDTLVDADLAQNAASWQWVAGCGADAAPFFRVFNPVLQGFKFDPDGSYVRRYVPELARLPNRYVHSPWDAPEDTLAQAGFVPGRDYPHPIIDLATGRDRALAAFSALPKPAA
jgi:deoxyribodipyrimidine photo-lyase